MASQSIQKKTNLVSSIEIGRILRSARRYTGQTQAFVAQELGVEQSAYSRIESGDQGLTTAQWFRFCEIAHMVPEAVRTGVIEFFKDDEPLCPPRKNLAAHRFKIPARYQRDAGSSVRAALPFLNYAEKVWGGKKAGAFVEAMGLSLDYFGILNNRLNLNFCIDLSRALIEKGDLRKEDVSKIAEGAMDSRIHGSMNYRYDGAKTGLELISSLVSISRKYECNFNYEEIGHHKDSIVLKISPLQHLGRFAYRSDPVLGDFLCQYKKAYFKNFSTRNGQTPVRIEERECHYRDAHASACIYEIHVDPSVR